MNSLDSRHRHIIRILKQQFGLSETHIEDVLIEERNYVLLTDFFHGQEKVSKLIFFYQTRDTFGDEGELIEAAGAPRHARPRRCLFTAAAAAAAAWRCRPRSYPLP